MASPYTTRKNDTWDAIAYRAYGLEGYFYLLLDANPDHVYTALFDAGVALTVPDLAETAPSSLPPWRVA